MKYREFTNDEAEMFVLLNTIEDKSKIDGLYNTLKAEPGGWVLEAIDKRFQAYNIECCKELQIMILTCCNGSVGKCARYVDDVARIYDEKNPSNIADKKISLEYYSKNIHMHGVPKL